MDILQAVRKKEEQKEEARERERERKEWYSDKT